MIVDDLHSLMQSIQSMESDKIKTAMSILYEMLWHRRQKEFDIVKYMELMKPVNLIENVVQLE